MSNPTTAVESAATDQPGSSGRVSLMSPPDRLGVAALVVAFLGGLWLMAAPFIVGYQGRSASWTHGTINIFAVGGGVAVLAFAALVVVAGGVLVELSRTAQRGPQHAETEDDEPLQ